jgi:hypothetical protein
MSAYYFATGIWPIVHMSSFEKVTGPKVDDWLVRMVGSLAAGNALALGIGAQRPVPSRETIGLAAFSALAFAAIDITYVMRKRIRPIYLGDAALELVFLALFLSAE